MHWKPNFVIFFAIKDSMCKSFVDNIRILCWVQSHHRNRVFHVEFFICCLLSNKLCLKKQGCRLQNRCRFCLFSLRWLSLNFSFCFTVAGIEGPWDTRSRWRPWPLVPTRTSSRCRRSNRRLWQQIFDADFHQTCFWKPRYIFLRGAWTSRCSWIWRWKYHCFGPINYFVPKTIENDAKIVQ